MNLAPTLEAMYRKYGPIIFARCRKLLRSEAAAEDATQEVFLRVSSRIGSIPERDALPWIHRTSTNWCLNLLRNERRHARALASLPASASADVEQEVARRELATALVATAAPRAKEIVELYYVSDLDQAEVARRAGVCRRTVINRLNEFTNQARRTASAM